MPTLLEIFEILKYLFEQNIATLNDLNEFVTRELGFSLENFPGKNENYQN